MAVSRKARLKKIAAELDALCAPVCKPARKTAKKSTRAKTVKASARKPKHEAFSPALVREVAKTLHGASRYGRSKVFIGDIAPIVARRTGLTIEQVKHELMNAHRRSELRLSRADLTSTMSPAKVAASEIPYLNATFHFVNDE